MEAGLINMTFKFIDYKKEFSNGNTEAVDSKWVSFDTFDGRHVEGIAYFDDRRNIRAHGYNGIVIANQGGGVMVPSADVFADSIRFIEPFTVPRIVLMDNTSITCQIDNPKPNGSYVQVVLLNGRRIKIHGMSIKYIEEPFSLNNNASTTVNNVNNTTAKPTRIIENHTTADTVDTNVNTATANIASTTNNSEAIPPARINANTANASNDSHMQPNAHTANAASTASNNGAQQFTNNNQVNANNANNTASNVPVVALNTDNDADDSVSFDDDYDDLDDDSELDTNKDTDSELGTYDDNDDLDTDDDSDSELDDTYDDSESDYDSESDDFDDDDTNANNANINTNTTSSHNRMRLPVHRLNNASSLSNIRKPVNKLEESSSAPMVNHDLNKMLASDDDYDDTVNEPGADDYWDDNDTILDLDTDDDNNGMNII